MRITNKSIYVLVAILWFLCAVIFVAVPFYCVSHLGANEMGNLVEIPSPDKSIIVDEFNVYGGATSPNLTQVFIRHRNERFDWWNGCCIFSIDGLKKTKITWLSDSQLEIQYQPGAVSRAASNWNGVRISYSQLK